MREFYAASVQEAVQKAASSLGTTPDSLEYRVVDQGSAGFLGIGARDARILVRGDTTLVPESSLEEDSESPSVVSESAATEPQEPEESGKEPGEDERSEEAPPVEEASEELLLEVDRFLTSLVDAMGLDATVDVFDSGATITADISSRQTGLLIGQKGETIDAIQYLVNVFAYKEHAFLKRITVDSEGYRQRRVEALQGMARRSARRAIREGQPVHLPPMSSMERRVIHVFLAEEEQVSTSSEGNEEERRVVISPF
jgi:spoIIIJ-associated protein